MNEMVFYATDSSGLARPFQRGVVCIPFLLVLALVLVFAIDVPLDYEHDDEDDQSFDWPARLRIPAPVPNCGRSWGFARVRNCNFWPGVCLSS